MTRSAPLVSIVLATNRTSRFLADALTSVQAQSYLNWELVVVDDGAPDSSAILRAAEAVSGARVIHQPPLGVSIARNAGVAQTRGEYLAFLDDDDRWLHTRLERQVQLLESRPDAVASFCGMRTIDSNGLVLAEAEQRDIDGRLAVARRDTGIILPNLLIRRTAFEQAGGFHSRIRQAEDLDLVLRLAELGSFVRERAVLVDYRAHDENTTKRHRELMRSIDHVLTLHRWAAVEKGDEELARALAESLRKNDRFAWWSALRAAKAALRQKQPGAALADVGWALRVAPRGLVDGVWRRARGIRD